MRGASAGSCHASWRQRDHTVRSRSTAGSTMGDSTRSTTLRIGAGGAGGPGLCVLLRGLLGGFEQLSLIHI